MTPEPPRLAEWLLRLSIGPACRDVALGDLGEEFAARCAERGRREAARWYWSQVWRSLGPNARRRAAAATWGQRDRLEEPATSGRFAGLGRDLRDGLRALRRSPGVAAVAVLTLALGIGANTAIFSLVDAVLLRELPVHEPRALVLFRNVDGNRGRMSRAGENNGSVDPVTGRNASTSFSLSTFERFQADHPGLSDVFAYAPFNQFTVVIDGQPEPIALGQFVSGDYFSGLGVSAIAGRALAPADDDPAAPPVAVISYRYWDVRFGGDRSVIGKTIQVNHVPVTLVGVTPPEFAGAMQIGESPDISLPLAQHGRFQPDRLASRSEPWYWWIRIMGRLEPGASAAQVRASLEPGFQDTARDGWLAGQTLTFASGDEIPASPTLAVDPGGQGENDRRRQYASSLRILMGLVSLVLLAACANVANLLLARAAARRPEIALRLALGATRGRVVRQLFLESLLLASLGAGLGVLISGWSHGLLLGLRQFGGAPAVLTMSLDGRVLGFTVVVTLATALVFGLLPALRATEMHLGAAFHGGARLLSAGVRSRLRQGLMILQIALSLALLVGAGLFVRTLRNLDRVDPGFNTQRLALFSVDASAGSYPRAQFASLHQRLREQLERIPAVTAVTFSRVPLLAGRRSNRLVSVAGVGAAPETSMGVNINGLAPNFLEAMEIPLVLGRPFADGDDADAPRVAVVDQAFTRKFLGDANPIGRRLVFSATPTGGAITVEIVGLIRDAKYTGLRQAAPTVYLPASQMADGQEGVANYYVRTAANPAAIGASIRAVVREIDPTLPVIDLHTEDEQIDRLNSEERLFARLSSVFGLVAVALASIGLYGLMSFLVQQRTGEIGLRLALGARPGQVLRMVLRESLALVAAGLALGVAAAYALGRFMTSMLFGLSSFDPLTYGTVAVLLVAVALLASLRPARRAARVDPIVTLRAE